MVGLWLWSLRSLSWRVSRDGAGALISAEHGITVLGVYNTLQSLGFEPAVRRLRGLAFSVAFERPGATQRNKERQRALNSTWNHQYLMANSRGKTHRRTRDALAQATQLRACAKPRSCIHQGSLR